MAYVTAEYYTDTFHGQPIPNDQFDRLAEMASDIIDAIVYVAIDPEKVDMTLVAKATAYEVECIYQQGGIDAITGKAASSLKTSEHLDDYTISESVSDGAADSALYYNGIPISSLAIAILRKLGLMCRWLYAGRGLHYDGY